MQVLFRPNPNSRATEVGTVTATDGDVLTISWSGQTFVRNRLIDFVRECP